jgi:CubicO group peptidase (beta-lactamase class C family)
MRICAFALIAALALGSGAARGDCAPPASGIDDWAIATPASVDLDGDRLCGLIPAFEKFREANLHAVLVVRHGKLVFERYFAGENPSPLAQDGGRAVAFNAETRHEIWSVTKSLTALMLGIAIERRWVAGIDEPVFSFFPEYADLRTPEKDRITLRHLLTMSHGLAWAEETDYRDPDNSQVRMMRATDPYRFVLEQPVVHAPGEKFVYSGASALLIGAILSKRTELGIDTLMQAHLFDPLGIADVEWARHRHTGDPMAEGGLRMRPRDLAKIGQLVLARGRWNGKQIVPAAWIEAATARQISTSPTPGWFAYGYQFWLWNTYLAKKGDVLLVAGLGYGGQRLVVVPSLDLVAVIHAGLYGSYLQRTMPLSVINNYILTAADGR